MASALGFVGFGRLFNAHPIGAGDPFTRSLMSIVSPPARRVPDDGGVRVVMAGSFDTARQYRVRVGQDGHWTVCYSGQSGSPAACTPNSDGSLSFIIPGGLDIGLWDLDIWATTGGEYQARTDALLVVRRERRLKSYEVARLFPAAIYGAARGPVDPTHDAVLD